MTPKKFKYKGVVYLVMPEVSIGDRCLGCVIRGGICGEVTTEVFDCSAGTIARHDSPDADMEYVALQAMLRLGIIKPEER